MDTTLISAAELARIVGVDPSHVRRLARSGQLPHYRVGSTYRFLLAEALAACRVESAECAAPGRPAPEAAPRRSRTGLHGTRKLDRRSLKAALFA